MWTSPLSRMRALFGLILGGLLAGCATLPSSGPTASEVKRGAERGSLGMQFRIVDIDQQTIERVGAAEAAARSTTVRLASLAASAVNDVVGPGDVLSIGIYEVGVTLFAGGAPADAAGFDPSAKGQMFPEVVVDRDGAIRLPYVGRLVVSGHTTADIEQMIDVALKGKSQSPQAIVGVRQNLSGTVYISGDVRRPGRLELSLQHERLLDAIALAGGSAATIDDTIVRLSRGQRAVEERLSDIEAGEPDDLVLVPGDRIELLHKPLTLVIMGATGRVAQVPFEASTVSLAEAVARAGGPSDVQADPTAVFLFRYDKSASATEVPIIYRLNMMSPASYFVAQRFAMQDKDVIFVANAAANRPAKLVNIVNQLFSPLITARAIAGN